MNIDNQDKSRAIKAEKQVERLERELELLKSRIKKTGTTSSTKELDKINFQLQEQVKDLKYQLKNQQSEYSKLKETLTTKTTEYEEKLKRMREIFGQASKNIDKYRVTIASKDVEIERLKTELQESQMKEHTYKATSESQQLTIEKVNAEITNAKTFYGTEIKQMEAKNRQLTIQLEQTKNDYEQYKKRARTLLETSKEEKLNLVRIDELEKLVQQLQAEKM
ncbi:uncharacterized protein BX663DRAFT_514801 [Cokeromyces recurvatus]|uniref:uncharacterized protein n=1 Tax=Cokeromyces recurvatus TaxID=90255 RepID=UPI00221F5DA5|nr:uncharacterized protein BX663DRAFT_514801 [Cokeromyces recurvatus]KAI7901542.1 hypothetical protein BX663DRAFT_514801 [Cokeromyces recurvatus]